MNNNITEIYNFIFDKVLKKPECKHINDHLTLESFIKYPKEKAIRKVDENLFEFVAYHYIGKTVQDGISPQEYWLNQKSIKNWKKGVIVREPDYNKNEIIAIIKQKYLIDITFYWDWNIPELVILISSYQRTKVKV